MAQLSLPVGNIVQPIAHVAQKLNTKKSAISRIENHAEDVRLSTLGKYAKVLGKKLYFSVG